MSGAGYRKSGYRGRKESLTGRGLSYRKEGLAMPWYQAVPVLGSAAALSIILLVRPSSDVRIPFTLLIGGLVLLGVGMSIKDVITGIYVAAWLGQ
jgi:hypothetical protein